MSIKYALETNSNNQFSKELLANTYVDNVIIGAHNVEEGIAKQKLSKETFKAMSMNLREFMTNDNDVFNAIPSKDRMKKTGSTVKLLGLKWDTSSDTLYIPIKTSSTEVLTKRTALKSFASTFDPLGLLAPLLVRAKMFIQDLWINKHSWDDPLDENSVSRWTEIVQGISGFNKKIPRFVAKSKEAKYDLVLFSDASQRVCAAVTYLLCKAPRENPVSNIIFSKTKLAVPKKSTIPRLELLALVLAIKSTRYLLKELKIPINTVHIFSDSQIILHWITSTKPLKTFVHNRVRYIKEVPDELKEASIASHFHFVNSEQNPADCATRGLTNAELAHHMWWHGPEFITSPVNEWPKRDPQMDPQSSFTDEVEREFKSINSVTAEGYKSVLPFNKTNSYTKLVHITAYVLKYIQELQSRAKKKKAHDSKTREARRPVVGPTFITLEDTRKADLVILREHYREGALQLHSRIMNRFQLTEDDNGIYRGNFRMGNSQLETSAKNPILLLPSHQLTRTIVTHYHEKLFHAGSSHLITALRSHYFIPRIRRVVNSVISKCITCRRHQGRCFSYPCAPDLPSQRVHRSRPFQNVGLDYFGTLKIRSEERRESKVWISLFTCMTTRALHLEVVEDNSALQFLLAFRRFVSRRGAPSYVVSDNAPTFKLGKEILVNELTQFKENPLVRQYTISQKLKWDFITPLSPWIGGFYERLVGSVKLALKKAIHTNIMSLWHLQTLIAEVEATLNTRPITPVITNSTDEPTALRPIDLISPQFTLANSLDSNPRANIVKNLVNSESHTYLIDYYTVLRDLLEKFWQFWHREYLHALAERNQSKSSAKQGSRANPSVGDVVLIKQENISRSSWPLALIIGINSSADGSVRSVKLKTGAHKTLDRSINQLIPLEITAQTKDELTTPKERLKKPARIQPSRAVKQK